MPGIGYQKGNCTSCKILLQDPVQLTCGHSFCRSCASDKLHNTQCPECKKEFSVICPFSGAGCSWKGKLEEHENHRQTCPRKTDLIPPEKLFSSTYGDEQKDLTQLGIEYFPDRFVRKEIKNLITICPYSEMGCNWEGKFEEYQQHIKECMFALLDCEHCGEKVRRDRMERHSPCMPKKCPLAIIGCSENSPQKQSDLQNHLQMGEENHLTLLVRKIALLQKEINKQPQAKHNTEQSLKKRAPIHTRVQDMMQRSLQEEVQTLMAELQSKDDEIASLKATVTKLEITVKSKSAELEDRDFCLSLIENSNHDGSMIWKIPQFSQRKADAENCKHTSIFSLPFYTGRYGYKMCLRLYIMGDGIGKGTHLSLFFVVMRGEFDNILQWPFTHKVTFKLINQAGGRDIVNTFQPDPMSSSFRKPKSDMNIASGCPRFVSHTELEHGGFVVDDTIFIKCTIDISTIHHP